MTYNFDEIIERRGSNCIKYDGMKQFYGTNELTPLWIADMDFASPDFVLDALKKRLEHPVLGYFNRTDSFYESIIDWMHKRHHWEIQKEWILFTPGVVTALATTVLAFTSPGDKVILQPPVYNPFFYVIENQDRKIVENPLKLDGDRFVFDFADLEAKLKAGAKLLILSNPHNPVGRCWQADELQTLSELCLQYHCLVLSDEIHSDLVLRGHRHCVTASLSPDIAANTITCMAPSKTFNLAGLTSAEIIVSNPQLRNRLQHLTYDALHLNNGNIFGDIALETAYREGEEWLRQLVDYLSDNLNYLQHFIKTELPMLKTFQHEATYLLWIDFSNCGLTHAQLWQKLVGDGKLALNDGIIYGTGSDKHFRLNFACPRSTLVNVMQTLKRLFPA